MDLEVKPLLYGHSEGHTDVTFSEDGKYLISCGTDGDVRIWKGFGDDDPFQTCLGDYLVCSKQKGDHLIIGGDDGKVKLLTFPSGESNGILTYCNSPINDIAKSSHHNWIAIASDDGTIQMIDIASKNVRTFPEFKKLVLSIAIDADAQYIAIRTGESSIEIIDVEQKTVIFVEKFEDEPHCAKFRDATNISRLEFDPTRKYLAYSRNTNIIILQKDSWVQSFTLTSQDINNSSFYALAFSPCGKYLAASTLEGHLLIFNMHSRSPMKYYTHPNAIKITALCWNPKQSTELAFCDSDGYIGLAINCYHVTLPKTTNNDSSNNLGIEFVDDFAEEDKELVEEDDDDDENTISLEKLKREVMGNDDDAAEDKVSEPQTPRPSSRTPEPPLQQAFMPSSSPEHFDPRYMCWNETGIIRCYGSSLDDEDSTRSIEIEFNDCTLHNSIMVANFQAFTMATMSSRAVAMANSNTFKVIPLGSSTKEWSLKLNEDDTEIVALAASTNLICIATNRYLVHACSIHGVQKCVFSVPGPVICMSAFGFVLMIAYHNGNWRKTDACVDVMLVKLEGMSIESRHLKAALAPETTIQWLGFTDVGTPAMQDSSGMLYLYSMQSNIWLPFCNTVNEAKSVLDGFFVTAVYESLSTVRGVKCRGSQYPVLSPVPTLAELELRAPFLNAESEINQLEANLFTWSSLQIENTTKKFKEAALKAFALGIKNDLNDRAMELMEMLQNTAILSLALKYANKLGKQRVSENLIALAKTLSVDEDVDDALGAVETPESRSIQPNRKLLATSSRKILNRSLKEGASCNRKEEVITDPSQDLFPTPMTSITTQDLAVLNEDAKMPFLKSLKKPNPQAHNPLSLTDKNAGVAIEKENKTDNTTEKRKLSDTSPAGKDSKKQKKLSSFTFSKRS